MLSRLTPSANGSYWGALMWMSIANKKRQYSSSTTDDIFCIHPIL
jgi:hypothetical protein